MSRDRHALYAFGIALCVAHLVGLSEGYVAAALFTYLALT